MRYYDALSPQVRVEHAERMRGFEQRRWPYPVALVDGEVISVGALSAFSLLQAVERAHRREQDGQVQ